MGHWAKVIEGTQIKINVITTEKTKYVSFPIDIHVTSKFISECISLLVVVDLF
jgi:hypothetical protein